ncbi:hypothetical protein GSS88_10125 [Corynebacterium sp. 3HC-13]|uniref:hypothetical protein n=1 Tax=Corynebacterium poyangense TaxID=2684405 RepID=UPI001CCBCA5A|nr:hypothetical protein [Corynebacterium poyangense]MBZ8178138.1 hypothetical protein [Corynebacterium poyangense]
MLSLALLCAILAFIFLVLAIKSSFILWIIGTISFAVLGVIFLGIDIFRKQNSRR